jgi:uncharacterized Tic20 family protein
MTNWYYYDQTGKKCGPVDSGTLKVLAQHGIITPATTILTEDGKGSLAGKVKGLEFSQPYSAPASVSVPPPVTSYPVSGSAPHAPYASRTVNFPVEHLLSQSTVSQTPFVNGDLLGMEPNTCFMLMHLAGFFFFPAAIILWAMTKDKDVRADIHGKVIFNWLISLFIYIVVGCILWIVAIGAILIVAASVCSFIFSMLAAVKALEGKAWRYPYSITFFRTGVVPSAIQ